MKCDELNQVENPIEWGLYYDKSDVDSAIDELKSAHHKERHEYINMIAELQEKLKEQTSIAEEGWKEFRTYHTSYAEAVKELYDKNKEISELKEKHKTEVKELLCLIRDKDNNFNRAFDSEEKELRHHKYKQCLAMARWCRSRACFYDTMREDGPYWSVKSDRAYKWYKWWFKTAVQFKEAK